MQNVIIWFIKNFNPLARMGRDQANPQRSGIRGISIHSPVWGETIDPIYKVLTGDISIHSPVWGETIDPIYKVLTGDISIHSPAKGETRFLPMGVAVGIISIHSPAKGETAQYSTVYREMTQAS
ncbi:TPA: hypothetical protein TVN95_000572 [Streptococcus equi subsp. zooepidemicus]|nr:hypothetical protein [Streptococcus equi subsp. zooepidemicus]